MCGQAHLVAQKKAKSKMVSAVRAKKEAALARQSEILAIVSAPEPTAVRGRSLERPCGDGVFVRLRRLDAVDAVVPRRSTTAWASCNK